MIVCFPGAQPGMFEGRASWDQQLQELDGFCAENQLESGPERAERDQQKS